MFAVEMGWRGWNSSKLKLWHNNIDLNKAMSVVLEKIKGINGHVFKERN